MSDRLSWPFVLIFVSIACDPQGLSQNNTEPTQPDAASASVDKVPDCTLIPGNLLTNPSFEVLAGGSNPNGQANNMGASLGTIPAWRGCCGTIETTRWTVTQEKARCGARSVFYEAKGAVNTVLIHSVDIPSDVGKTVSFTGWFSMSSGANGSVSLDVFDNGAPKTVLAESPALAGGSEGWVLLKTAYVVPAGGRLEFRIVINGTVTGYVDDLTAQIR